jgi:hypothetical protein
VANSAVGLLWTGFISIMVADKQASLQLDCIGEALSAVQLLWTGFISSRVALNRLYQQ